jgi:hypothetical protein
MVPEGQRPHPRACYGRGVGLEDAVDHRAIRTMCEWDEAKTAFVPLALSSHNEGRAVVLPSGPKSTPSSSWKVSGSAES